MCKSHEKTSEETFFFVQGTPEGYETSAARSFVLLRRTPRAPGICWSAGGEAPVARLTKRTRGADADVLICAELLT